MKLTPGIDSSRIVGDDGYVSVKGHRVGQVMKLKRTGRWIWRARGGTHSGAITWGNREDAVDALITAVTE